MFLSSTMRTIRLPITHSIRLESGAVCIDSDEIARQWWGILGQSIDSQEGLLLDLGGAEEFEEFSWNGAILRNRQIQYGRILESLNHKQFQIMKALFVGDGAATVEMLRNSAWDESDPLQVTDRTVRQTTQRVVKNLSKAGFPFKPECPFANGVGRIIKKNSKCDADVTCRGARL